jgi:alpha-galactosidase
MHRISNREVLRRFLGVATLMALGFVFFAVDAVAEELGILTPPAPTTAQIHGAKVYGVRPGHPFLYRIPATGTRPMTFSAKGLPAGLTLDTATGIITGSVKDHGEYSVLFRAKNSIGAAERPFKIVVGDQLALTPPMGWSTWYLAELGISDQLVRAQADALVSSGLVNHGYSYVNIDDGWNIKPNSADPALGGPARNADGSLRSNKNFPDMKALTDYAHSKGLKTGIYISPGPLTCGGFEGSYRHEEQDAKQFAKWGFDFLKYDLCSYNQLLKEYKPSETVAQFTEKYAGRNRAEELRKPYALMGSILKTLDRDFVYNLCEYGLGNVWEWGREVGGHFWRTNGDVGDPGMYGVLHPASDGSLYSVMTGYGFGQAGEEKWAGPGGWNDPDNILIGRFLWHPNSPANTKPVPTPLTRNEQYTWVTLWSLLSAPLVFGGDMTSLDDFTLSLLTNDEVIDVDQDVLGRQAAPVSRNGDVEIWAKQLEDGSKAIGLFNRGEKDSEIIARWPDLSITGKQFVRDLWRQKDVGVFDSEFRMPVGRHGAAMLLIKPVAPAAHNAH